PGEHAVHRVTKPSSSQSSRESLLGPASGNADGRHPGPGAAAETSRRRARAESRPSRRRGPWWTRRARSMIFVRRLRLRNMERETTGAELLLSEPEIVALRLGVVL